MELQAFKKKCASIAKRGVNLTTDVNELVQDAIDSAKLHGDFNRASLCLSALWDGRLYSPTKTIIEYFKAHGPFDISQGKNEDGSMGFKVKKDTTELAQAWVDKRVPYYSWEKPKVEAQLTLDSAKKRFEMLLKQAHEKLSPDERVEFDKMVVKRAANLGSSDTSDGDIQAPQAEAA